MQLPESDIVRIYIKGAPEFVVNKCVKTFKVDGDKTHMDDEQLNYILSTIVYDTYTSKGLRAMAFAYKDMTCEEFEALKA